MNFTKEQEVKLEIVKESECLQLLNLNSKELEKMAIDWSYYSAKIEGNAYNYEEAKLLLLGTKILDRPIEDAIMLKNLFEAFSTVLNEIIEGRTFTIDYRTIMSIHSKLTKGLVANEERGLLRNRPVKISGTSYEPPYGKLEIELLFEKIIKDSSRICSPIEQAVFIHCNVARLQPFIDGNKRTSRFLESIILMQGDLIPIYSIRDKDIEMYRKSLLYFYEKEDYEMYLNYLLSIEFSRIDKK